MSTQLLDEVVIGPAAWDAGEKRETLLAVHKKELSYLRFSILLTGKWEALGGMGLERRNDLRAELAGLRRSYSQKVDEIAMAFSVQDAMNAQQEIERTVILPPSMKPSQMLSEYDQLRF